MGVRQIQILFFPFKQSVSSVWGHKHAVYFSVFYIHVFCMGCFHMVTLIWHFLYVLWKTKRLASSVWWNALNHVVTITLKSLLSNPMMAPVWQVTTIEGTSPSICAVAIASTSPWSNLLSFPLPAFHLFFPLQYSYHSLREERRRSRLLAFWKL